MNQPRVLLIAGYFDYFSGYQETVLARSLSRMTELEVMASDRVAPIFTDEHLAGLGIDRRYPVGIAEENGIPLRRVATCERRGMVWGRSAVKHIEQGDYDLIVQVMPGQGLPIAASIAETRAKRVALYGDNSAMWAQLSPRQRQLKSLVFAQTKGRAYRFVNKRAEVAYGYTPETLTRLARFSPHPMHLLPLGFDEQRFFYSPDLRARARLERGYQESDRVIISAGKLDPRKKLGLLVKAFALSFRDDPRLRLVLVGSDGGSHARELQSLIDSLGVASVTRVEGFMDHSALNAVFNSADMGVWPRQPAITIQQAMGTGLPVVIPRNPWVEHLVTPTTGEFIPVDCTIEELNAGMVKALRMAPSTRESRVRASTRFGGIALAQTLLADSDLC